MAPWLGDLDECLVERRGRVVLEVPARVGAREDAVGVVLRRPGTVPGSVEVTPTLVPGMTGVSISPRYGRGDGWGASTNGPPRFWQPAAACCGMRRRAAAFGGTVRGKSFPLFTAAHYHRSLPTTSIRRSSPPRPTPEHPPHCGCSPCSAVGPLRRLAAASRGAGGDRSGCATRQHGKQNAAWNGGGGGADPNGDEEVVRGHQWGRNLVLQHSAACCKPPTNGSQKTSAAAFCGWCLLGW